MPLRTGYRTKTKKRLRCLQNDRTDGRRSELHEKPIDETGGSHGIRDSGLLASAVLSCENAFDDVMVIRRRKKKQRG